MNNPSDIFLRECKIASRYMSDLLPGVASMSKDGTKVGAVLFNDDWQVIATGRNGMPRKVVDTDEARWNKPEKYEWVVHAEVNAVCTAAATGAATKNSTLLVNNLPPCSRCAGVIINAGVRRIFCVKPEETTSPMWAASFERSVQMFKEADVRLWLLDLHARRVYKADNNQSMDFGR